MPRFTRRNLFHNIRPPRRFVYPLTFATSDCDDEGLGSSLEQNENAPFQDHAMTVAIPHHFALKTRNITTAIQFYSILGWNVETKFRAGPARAAWLRLGSNGDRRLELIEVPGYLLQEPEGMRRQAINLFQNPTMLGWNHMALDATNFIHALGEHNNNNASLSMWLQALNTTSLQRFGKSLRIAMEPRQQIIGQGVYELAFLYDPDGCLVEILAKINDLPQSVSSGWEPWNGKDFHNAFQQ